MRNSAAFNAYWKNGTLGLKFGIQAKTTCLRVEIEN